MKTRWLVTTFTARTANDTNIAATLNRQSPNTTKVRIRAGAVGGQNVSQQVLDKIKKHF
jgi:hypothetical protein